MKEGFEEPSVPEKAPLTPDALSEKDAAEAFDAAVAETGGAVPARQKNKGKTLGVLTKMRGARDPDRPSVPKRPGPPSYWPKIRKFVYTNTRADTISGLGLILFVITAVTALVLSTGYALTRDVIEERELAARDEAMRAVIDADTFLPSGDAHILLALRNGEAVGYAVTVTPIGYGGPIPLIVGVSPDYKLTGVSSLSMYETPGFGARIQTEPEFLEQFAQRGLPLVYGEHGLDALAGATVTSDAILEGAREAIKRVIDYEMGGG